MTNTQFSVIIVWCQCLPKTAGTDTLFTVKKTEIILNISNVFAVLNMFYDFTFLQLILTKERKCVDVIVKK